MILVSVTSGLSATAEPIRGAGSTFAAPIIARWAALYRDMRVDSGDYTSPDWTVDYELVGSLAGLMRLEELDFAASDVPISHEELAKRGYQQFPIITGGIAIITNLDGLPPEGLRLSGPVLADIFLGKIQSWSDPSIKALNPGIKLPDLKISVVHRRDGSGSTFVFTEYLSSISEEWKARHGADTLMTWPVGISVKGTQELLQVVQSSKGAISYAEYGQASRVGVPVASIRSRAGTDIKPNPESILAAVNSVAWAGTKSFFASLTDLPSGMAYPITAMTYVVVPASRLSRDRYLRVQDFFWIAFGRGSDDARALGYVPLPPPLIEQVQRSWIGDHRSANWSGQAPASAGNQH